MAYACEKDFVRDVVFSVAASSLEPTSPADLDRF